MIPLVTNPFYSYSFAHNHRFPMEKFHLLASYLEEQSLLTSASCFRPGQVRREVLSLGHCEDYIERFVNNRQSRQEIRRMGLPWSAGLVKRTLISPNGTLLTANLALKHGIACHLAGGTHHAHYDFASGFCIFNDLAVTAKTLLRQGKITRLLIFDCDVHQGDGTAAILADEPTAFTCSIHCEKNFPARKACSDFDIELPIAMADDDYLATVDRVINQVLEQTQPDLVLYDAGVDIYQGDPLGLLDISLQGIRKRDAMVLAACWQRSIPVATVIGGGYDDDRQALAKRHAIVVEEAAKRYRD